MTKRERYGAQLAALLDAPAELERFLVQRSALPGRRANLELAAALADALGKDPPGPALWEALQTWAAVDSPTNTPREFLPFCAVQALGACYLDLPADERRQIVEAIRAAARDPRWRAREAACFALQRLGEGDAAELLRLLAAWRADASPLDLRAMLVALAHPPLLEEAAVVEHALELADESLQLLAELTGEEARVLGKCLGFAPSVFAAADPARGFALLGRWAGDERVEVKKIVAANLRKARLARHFPDEVLEVGELLSAG
jgi:hypothetical protein